ncbi:MAG: hypothetical protein WA160_00265 [Pseudobdellovibrio sp.]
MKLKIIFFILLFFNVLSNADEISVVDVRRNIPLSDDDTVYKDFAINAGSSSGLKKNLVVLAKRKISIKDASSKTIGEIEATVAQLKVIHVDSKVSIAREYKLISRDEEPLLESIGIMNGDRIDLAGSFIDNKPLVYKKNLREPSSATAPVANSKSATEEHGEAAPPVEKSVTPQAAPIHQNSQPLPEI